jgi:hypothetical protein
MRTLLFSVFTVFIECAGTAAGSVTEYNDRASWEAAVGAFTSIRFTEVPVNVIVTDQYASYGATFTDGDDFSLASAAFINDGTGLHGSPTGSISITFAAPQHWIAVDFPGDIQFALLRAGEVVHTSGLFGVGGVGNFGGLVSTEPFDAVRLYDPFDPVVVIDDLHFGVPAPGALMLLCVAALAPRRRRLAEACTLVGVRQLEQR